MSKGFTKLQLGYIEHRANGMSQGAAARAAGAAPMSAAVQASRWEANPRIVEAIKAKRKGVPLDAGPSGSDPTVELAERAANDYGIEPHEGNPLALLLAVAASPKVPLTLRIDTAKAALPYCHARLGEKGKRENKQDDAKVVGKGKFGQGEAPSTGNVVRMKRRAG